MSCREWRPLHGVSWELTWPKTRLDWSLENTHDFAKPIANSQELILWHMMYLSGLTLSKRRITRPFDTRTMKLLQLFRRDYPWIERVRDIKDINLTYPLANYCYLIHILCNQHEFYKPPSPAHAISSRWKRARGTWTQTLLEAWKLPYSRPIVVKLLVRLQVSSLKEQT